MNTTYFFRLNQTEKIVILLQDPVEWLGPIYEENIILINNENSFLLADGPIYYNMQQLTEYLKKALNNELQLHMSISSDIGYLCNEYSYNETGFTTHTFPSGVIDWIGYKYHVWEYSTCDVGTTTWIYNDKNKNIILEITPNYPYLFCEPKEEPNYIPYNEWIKTYKPYLIREIPATTAQEWLDQAEFIIKTIESNESEWQKKRIKQ